MKKISSITLNEELSMSGSTKDKFFLYAKKRLQSLHENKDVNENVQMLFKDGVQTVDHLLERFYINHNGDSYESLIESFDVYTETNTEKTKRFNECIKRYCDAITTNINLYPYLILNEAIEINALRTMEFLLNEGSAIAQKIDVANKFDSSLFESNVEKNTIAVKDEPIYILGLTESIGNGIKYVLQKHKFDTNTTEKCELFLENLTNVYSTYKEGLDLIKTQETEANELFNMFIRDMITNYQLSIQHIEKTLTDPVSFVQISMRYFNQWIIENRQRLQYKFPVVDFERLNNLSIMLETQHPMFDNKTQFDSFYFTYPKMYQLLDILLSISQLLRMDLRSLTTKYINILRPMIDSYRLDYERSKTRTGY